MEKVNPSIDWGNYVITFFLNPVSHILMDFSDFSLGIQKDKSSLFGQIYRPCSFNVFGILIEISKVHNILM